MGSVVLQHDVQLSLMISLEAVHFLAVAVLQLFIEPSKAGHVLSKLTAHELERVFLGREHCPRLFLKVLHLRSQALDPVFVDLVQLGEELVEFEHLASCKDQRGLGVINLGKLVEDINLVFNA